MILHSEDRADASRKSRWENSDWNKSRGNIEALNHRRSVGTNNVGGFTCGESILSILPTVIFETSCTIMLRNIEQFGN